MPLPNQATVTINGAKVLIDHGVNTFANIVAAGAQKGACSPKSKMVTVASAAPSQGSTVGPNGSYVVSGGEVFTIA